MSKEELIDLVHTANYIQGVPYSTLATRNLVECSWYLRRQQVLTNQLAYLRQWRVLGCLRLVADLVNRVPSEGNRSRQQYDVSARAVIRQIVLGKGLLADLLDKHLITLCGPPSAAASFLVHDSSSRRLVDDQKVACARIVFGCFKNGYLTDDATGLFRQLLNLIDRLTLGGADPKMETRVGHNVPVVGLLVSALFEGLQSQSVAGKAVRKKLMDMLPAPAHGKSHKSKGSKFARGVRGAIHLAAARWHSRICTEPTGDDTTDPTSADDLQNQQAEGREKAMALAKAHFRAATAEGGMKWLSQWLSSQWLQAQDDLFPIVARSLGWALLVTVIELLAVDSETEAIILRSRLEDMKHFMMLPVKQLEVQAQQTANRCKDYVDDILTTFAIAIRLNQTFASEFLRPRSFLIRFVRKSLAVMEEKRPSRDLHALTQMYVRHMAATYDFYASLCSSTTVTPSRLPDGDVPCSSTVLLAVMFNSSIAPSDLPDDLDHLNRGDCNLISTLLQHLDSVYQLQSGWMMHDTTGAPVANAVKYEMTQNEKHATIATVRLLRGFLEEPYLRSLLLASDMEHVQTRGVGGSGAMATQGNLQSGGGVLRVLTRLLTCGVDVDIKAEVFLTFSAVAADATYTRLLWQVLQLAGVVEANQEAATSAYYSSLPGHRPGLEAMMAAGPSRSADWHAPMVQHLMGAEQAECTYATTCGFLATLRALFMQLHAPKPSDLQLVQNATMGVAVDEYVRYVLEDVFGRTSSLRYSSAAPDERWKLLSGCLSIFNDALETYYISSHADTDGNSKQGIHAAARTAQQQACDPRHDFDPETDERFKSLGFRLMKDMLTAGSVFRTLVSLLEENGGVRCLYQNRAAAYAQGDDPHGHSRRRPVHPAEESVSRTDLSALGLQQYDHVESIAPRSAGGAVHQVAAATEDTVQKVAGGHRQNALWWHERTLALCMSILHRALQLEDEFNHAFLAVHSTDVLYSLHDRLMLHAPLFIEYTGFVRHCPKLSLLAARVFHMVHLRACNSTADKLKSFMVRVANRIDVVEDAFDIVLSDDGWSDSVVLDEFDTRSSSKVLDESYTGLVFEDDADSAIYGHWHDCHKLQYEFVYMHSEMQHQLGDYAGDVPLEAYMDHYAICGSVTRDIIRRQLTRECLLNVLIVSSRAQRTHSVESSAGAGGSAEARLSRVLAKRSFVTDERLCDMLLVSRPDEVAGPSTSRLAVLRSLVSLVSLDDALISRPSSSVLISTIFANLASQPASRGMFLQELGVEHRDREIQMSDTASSQPHRHPQTDEALDILDPFSLRVQKIPSHFFLDRLRACTFELRSANAMMQDAVAAELKANAHESEAAAAGADGSTTSVPDSSLQLMKHLQGTMRTIESAAALMKIALYCESIKELLDGFGVYILSSDQALADVWRFLFDVDAPFGQLQGPNTDKLSLVQHILLAMPFLPHRSTFLLDRASEATAEQIQQDCWVRGFGAIREYVSLEGVDSWTVYNVPGVRALILKYAAPVQGSQFQSLQFLASLRRHNSVAYLEHACLSIVRSLSTSVSVAAFQRIPTSADEAVCQLLNGLMDFLQVGSVQPFVDECLTDMLLALFAHRIVALQRQSDEGAAQRVEHAADLMRLILHRSGSQIEHNPSGQERIRVARAAQDVRGQCLMGLLSSVDPHWFASVMDPAVRALQEQHTAAALIQQFWTDRDDDQRQHAHRLVLLAQLWCIDPLTHGCVQSAWAHVDPSARAAGASSILRRLLGVLESAVRSYRSEPAIGMTGRGWVVRTTQAPARQLFLATMAVISQILAGRVQMRPEIVDAFLQAIQDPPARGRDLLLTCFNAEFQVLNKASSDRDTVELIVGSIEGLLLPTLQVLELFARNRTIVDLSPLRAWVLRNWQLFQLLVEKSFSNVSLSTLRVAHGIVRFLCALRVASHRATSSAKLPAAIDNATELDRRQIPLILDVLDTFGCLPRFAKAVSTRFHVTEQEKLNHDASAHRWQRLLRSAAAALTDADDSHTAKRSASIPLDAAAMAEPVLEELWGNIAVCAMQLVQDALLPQVLSKQDIMSAESLDELRRQIATVFEADPDSAVGHEAAVDEMVEKLGRVCRFACFTLVIHRDTAGSRADKAGILRLIETTSVCLMRLLAIPTPSLRVRRTIEKCVAELQELLPRSSDAAVDAGQFATSDAGSQQRSGATEPDRTMDFIAVMTRTMRIYLGNAYEIAFDPAVTAPAAAAPADQPTNQWMLPWQPAKSMSQSKVASRPQSPMWL